jgi:hypothetical protein
VNTFNSYKTLATGKHHEIELFGQGNPEGQKFNKPRRGFHQFLPGAEQLRGLTVA